MRQQMQKTVGHTEWFSHKRKLPVLSKVEVYRRVCGGFFAFSLWLALVSIPALSYAQCSMCRAVTESNLKTDDAFTIGNGLNNAIIYLMFIPYILAGIFIYAFYGKQIKAWLKKKFV